MGCTGSRVISGSEIPDGSSARDIIALVNGQADKVSTFHAKGTVTIESPSLSHSATFDLALHRPDSARVLVNGPFGIHLASVLLVGGRFVFYNHFKNEVTEGDISLDKLPAMMNLTIHPRDVVNAFCGARTFDADEAVPDSMNAGETVTVLYFHHAAANHRYTVDRRIGRILHVQILDGDGEIISEEFYDYARREDGTVRPQSVRMVSPRMDSAVSLFYDSVTVNEPVGRMALSIPADAVRVQAGSSTISQ
jgi:outer membrane lipoprotein-sorting protein